ncbi:MAG: RNA-binding protein [Pseudomonadota bacterium]|nr:RNA-binding protein [Pseudomonadota bacterium]
MPKGPRGEKRPADVIGNAVLIAKIATGEAEDTRLKEPAKRKSGLAGSKARAEKLTAEERSEIARKAAARRWG